MRHLLFALLLIPLSVHAEVISGPATVVDGDTLDVTGTRVRLFGMDAPEDQQTCNRDGTAWACGKDASAFLRSLVDGRTVTCERQDTDRYGRMVAVCAADGVDLGGAMVSGGLAVALPQFTDVYVEREARLRTLRFGIWGSDFQTPAEYRAANPRSEPKIAPAVREPRARRPGSSGRPSVSSSSGCAIKGNRNRRGEWIYHLPGMPYYDVTRPEEIFCTEAQARAAGYRRAIVRQ